MKYIYEVSMSWSWDHHCESQSLGFYKHKEEAYKAMRKARKSWKRSPWNWEPECDRFYGLFVTEHKLK